MPPIAAPVVLIASADVTAAALLGGLVETFGYAVAFASDGLSTDEQYRRLRPKVLLVDAATTQEATATVVARATMRGVGVILFGPRSLMYGMRELASRHELDLLFTPVDPGPLADALDRAVQRAG